MQQGYGLGQETSTLEHQAQESVAECGDNCICVQLDGFDITLIISTCLSGIKHFVSLQLGVVGSGAVEN